MSEITPELVRCLLAEQFPQWAALPIRPVAWDGWDNRTLRLGETMSVRLPSADSYAAQVEKEQRWLPLLAPHLPLAIPRPLAQGGPGCGFPRPWSVYEWLPGEHLTVEGAGDTVELAADLSAFLAALRRVDATGGPAPGIENFFRGGPLETYDAETRAALDRLAPLVDAQSALAAWEAALATTWAGPPVWFHGDVAPTNLLVRDGRLSAVIDFGSSGVGDPACDLVIAWTFFTGESRDAFREGIDLDEGTWARARGWALWKAAITLAGATPSEAERAGLQFGWRQSALAVIEDVLRAG